MEIFSKRLKILISDTGLTQKDFAKKYNFGVKQLNFWINNKAEPDMQAIVKFCAIFNVSADYLLGIKDY